MARRLLPGRWMGPAELTMLLIRIRRFRYASAAVTRAHASLFALFVILYMSIIGTKPLQEKVATSAVTEGDNVRQLVYLGCFGLLLFVAQVHRKPGRLMVFPAGITLLILWSCISIGWALYPSIAIRRLMLTVIMMWMLFRIVDEIGYDGTVRVLRISTAIALVLNYVAMVISPLSVHQFTEVGDANLIGNWRGMLAHKNWAGALCAVTLLIYIFDAARVRLLLRLAVIAGAAFFLMKTHSKTSIGILGIAVAAGILFQRYNPAYRAVVIALLVIVGSGVVLFADVYWDALTAPFANQTAFTGRVQVWPVLLAYANDHWMLGSGFGSFWNVGQAGPIVHYAKGWVAGVGNGHNGYLDMLIQLGFPGMMMAIFAFVLWPMARLLVTTVATRGEGALTLSMLIFCAGHNLTESSLMDRDMMVQIFFCLAVALIGYVVRRKPLKSRLRAMRQPVNRAGAADTSADVEEGAR